MREHVAEHLNRLGRVGRRSSRLTVLPFHSPQGFVKTTHSALTPDFGFASSNCLPDVPSNSSIIRKSAFEIFLRSSRSLKSLAREVVTRYKRKSLSTS